jgi:hypothetical protein
MQEINTTKKEEKNIKIGFKISDLVIEDKQKLTKEEGTATEEFLKGIFQVFANYNSKNLSQMIKRGIEAKKIREQRINNDQK